MNVDFFLKRVFLPLIKKKIYSTNLLKKELLIFIDQDYMKLKILRKTHNRICLNYMRFIDANVYIKELDEYERQINILFVNL